jgi:hypothetical protein
MRSSREPDLPYTPARQVSRGAMQQMSAIVARADSESAQRRSRGHRRYSPAAPMLAISPFRIGNMFSREGSIPQRACNL